MTIDILGAIVAGLAGTAVMTILMYMMPVLGMPKMDMPRMLGFMLVDDDSAAFWLGLVIHFMMGAVFAIVYTVLWSWLAIAVTWWWGLIFGMAHGVIATIMMPAMMGMHPRRERLDMEMNAILIVGILMGHMIFGLLVALVYTAFR